MDILSTAKLGFLRNKLKESEKFLIITHQNPDGDAIGSALGLFHALKNFGIESKVIVPNDFPGFLKWMPASDEILVFEKNKKQIIGLLEEKPFIFFLDFNDISRTGKIKETIEKNSSFSILIDHHPDPGDFANITLSHIGASSTAELVYQFVKSLLGNHVIDKPVAECLYAGIMTDTGSFSYNSSNPLTYAILSELLSFGIDKDDIYSNVYDNFSKDRMKLLGYCLDQKMVVLENYGTAYISLTNEEKKKYNFQPGDSEGFVNFPLSISGINFSAYFMENGKKVKISFRSKGDFPANLFAEKYFNGGGHKNAAGGESDLSIDKAVERFVELLPGFIETLTNE